MTGQIEAGHEHQTSRGAVIIFSRSWWETVSDGQVRSYVDALVELCHQNPTSVVDTAAALRSKVENLALHLPDSSYQRTAELIRGCSQLQICAPDGTVLYSDPGLDSRHPSRRSPDVYGTEDPADADRPGFGA